MDTRNVSLDLMEFVEQNILPRAVNLQKPITRTSLKLTLITKKVYRPSGFIACRSVDL